MQCKLQLQLGRCPCLLLSIIVLTKSFLQNINKHLPNRPTVTVNLDKLLDDSPEDGMGSSFLYIPIESAGFRGRVPGKVPPVDYPLRSFIGHAMQNRSSSKAEGYSLVQSISRASTCQHAAPLAPFVNPQYTTKDCNLIKCPLEAKLLQWMSLIWSQSTNKSRGLMMMA